MPRRGGAAEEAKEGRTKRRGKADRREKGKGRREEMKGVEKEGKPEHRGKK